MMVVKDDTLKIMKNLRKNDNRICYLNLSRNFGKETAMIAGLDYAKRRLCSYN